ncbi:MAG: hypothetical protein EA398_11650 [Deltaproteobacteria bacterium]|nr:MAG: hypothetical protein EA398_11650 [Deltaproteobacteria bacterium]
MAYRDHGFSVRLEWSVVDAGQEGAAPSWGPGPQRRRIEPESAESLRRSAEAWLDARSEAVARGLMETHGGDRGHRPPGEHDAEDGPWETATTAEGESERGPKELLDTVVGDEEDPLVVAERFRALYDKAILTCQEGTIAGIPVRIEAADMLPAFGTLRLCVSVGEEVAMVAPDSVQAPADSDLARLTAAWCLWLGYGSATIVPPAAHFSSRRGQRSVAAEAARAALQRTCNALRRLMETLGDLDVLHGLAEDAVEQSSRYLPHYEAMWAVGSRLSRQAEQHVDRMMHLAGALDEDPSWDLATETLRDASLRTIDIPGEWVAEDLPNALCSLFDAAAERATALRRMTVAKWIEQHRQTSRDAGEEADGLDLGQALQTLRWIQATDAECVEFLSPKLWQVQRYSHCAADLMRLRCRWLLRHRNLGAWQRHTRSAIGLTRVDALVATRVARDVLGPQGALDLLLSRRGAFLREDLADILPHLHLAAGQVREAADSLRIALLPEGPRARPVFDTSAYRLFCACAPAEEAERLRHVLLLDGDEALDNRLHFAAEIGDTHAIAELLPRWLDRASTALSKVEKGSRMMVERLRTLLSAGFHQVAAECGEQFAELLVRSRRHSLYGHVSEAMHIVLAACEPYPDQRRRAARWIEDLRARHPNKRTLWNNW